MRGTALERLWDWETALQAAVGIDDRASATRRHGRDDDDGDDGDDGDPGARRRAALPLSVLSVCLSLARARARPLSPCPPLAPTYECWRRRRGLLCFCAGGAFAGWRGGALPAARPAPARPAPGADRSAQSMCARAPVLRRRMHARLSRSHIPLTPLSLARAHRHHQKSRRPALAPPGRVRKQHRPSLLACLHKNTLTRARAAPK
jgi:hypothetical protein